MELGPEMVRRRLQSGGQVALLLFRKYTEAHRSRADLELESKLLSSTYRNFPVSSSLWQTTTSGLETGCLWVINENSVL